MGIATIGGLNNDVSNVHGCIIASWSLLKSKEQPATQSERRKFVWQ
jgi:hypothetical protein